MKRRVVITGMGTVNPIGNNLEESWENIKKGVCGIGPITQIDVTDHAVKLAGEVKNFSTEGIIEKKEARRMERFSQLALVSAVEAFNQSGLDMRMHFVVVLYSLVVSADLTVQRIITKLVREEALIRYLLSIYLTQYLIWQVETLLSALDLRVCVPVL